MDIIRVGINKDYTNINTAIGVATEGDIILIDPGDYSNQGTISLTKPVHLVGDTKDVVNNRVQIYRLSFSSCTPTKVIKVIIENLFIYYNYSNHYIFYSSTAWSIKAEVIFNKCYITNSFYGYCLAYWYSDAFVSCINCFLITKYFYTTGSASDTSQLLSTIRTVISSSYHYLNTVYQDDVLIDTRGYGVDYGYSYFKLPSKYCFKGVITEEGVPVSRDIKAYRRDNDVIMAATTSNATTGKYKLVTEYSGEHYLICRDDAFGEQYNDLVRAKVIPVIEDYEQNEWFNSPKFILTINHTLINETLIGFPLLIKIGSSSGINNFDTTSLIDELYSEYFATRWSIQTLDGQQLYSEVVKWDRFSKEAIFWVQVPIISSSEDTVLILFYNKLMPDNAFNVGYSGNITTSHMWGTNIIGIWHMTEDPGNVNDIRDSTYRRNHATPYNLGSNTSETTPLGKAIDFSNGYLKISNSIQSLYTTDMTLQAVVKFDDINTRGTIFCEGKPDKGWEVGVDDGKLFSCMTEVNNNCSIYTTLSGIDTSTWYLITALVDTTNSVMSIYLDEDLKSSYNLTIGNYKGNTGDTIGTSYLSSPYEGYNEEGVQHYSIIPIQTVSGTVVSGTVLLLYSNGVNYYDKVGRHTFVEKRPGDTYIEPDDKKINLGSIKSTAGPSVDDGINEYNYTKIENNINDFEFGTDDFTITAWVKSYMYRSGTTSDAYTTIFGDASGSMDTCITLRRRYYFLSANGWHYYYYYLTIPNDYGGFILNNQLIYTYPNNSTSVVWEHLALVRKDGIISFYLNGQEKYSVYSSDYIPITTYSGGIFSMAAFTYNTSPPYSNYYLKINSLEIVRGYARWSGNFSITSVPKQQPDTFFSGQIDEVMLYREVKTQNYINVFYNNIIDNLITYSI